MVLGEAVIADWWLVNDWYFVLGYLVIGQLVIRYIKNCRSS
jgi:hypothetical protein